MFTRINSSGIQGIGAYPVSVEADVANGLPGFSISGQATFNRNPPAGPLSRQTASETEGEPAASFPCRDKQGKPAQNRKRRYSLSRNTSLLPFKYARLAHFSSVLSSK